MNPPSDRSLASVAALYRADEEACLNRLFDAAKLTGAERSKAIMRATRWIEEIRRTHRPHASVTDLLARFGLSSQEGLALMCLAEALLRIPDPATADALIRDKLGETHWNEALGAGTSWSINAAGWALAITGKIIDLDDPTRHKPGTALGRLVSRLGQPVIREAIRHAMQWLADQFVLGETIDAALKRAEPAMEKGTRFSFDMLGEGARTAADAERYYQEYMNAVETIGAFQKGKKFPRPAGISVKLSALHPRYEMSQRERVLTELTPRLASLCKQAAYHAIPLTIDAEEADRLHLSLEIATELFKQIDQLKWEGLGFAVQAYQKRAPAVIDYLAGRARAANRRIHVRLVKGAYWDTEIKRAQERGWDDFPIFTRKASTDVSYHACARRMLAARDCINPVFGTHNALTVAHIAELACVTDTIEFQRLHGMGEELYALMQREGIGCCIYAPVGNHEVLLGYLVRRILENGANNSFVHRVLDRSVSVADLTADPVDGVKSYAMQFNVSSSPSMGEAQELRLAPLASPSSCGGGNLSTNAMPVEKSPPPNPPPSRARANTLRHPHIRRAPDLYTPARRNSGGLDLNDPCVAEPLLAEIANITTNPDVTNALSVDEMFESAKQGYRAWSRETVNNRATCLEKLADLLEQSRPVLMHFLIYEAGKTVVDSLGEVREAVDFCRYYAAEARQQFKPVEFAGPTGERNIMHYAGRGTFVCISPWNFPLAIFLGQVTAALVSGNAVIAKPAPQTPRIAAYTTRLIHELGIPANVFQITFGATETGAAIVAHRDVAGVAFTGSTAAARAINRSLAAKDGPIVPLIAETGGQNAMIVDGSALAEQVIDDVVTSAFRSTGQRCSALRLLCVPEATADKILAVLKGAMQELRIGNPAELATDIGPVIDADAQRRLLVHIDRLNREAKMIASTPWRETGKSYFIVPQAWEIPNIAWLTGEVFGPILHVIRYRPENLADLIAEINATGFGLTAGLHSRIESTVRFVETELRAGNLYINRSMIGATVGVQPFGGEGLSGTGPKAGGPHYLHRFALERVTSNNTTAAGGNASLLMEMSR